MPISEKEFLSAFFAEDETVCLRAFPDSKRKGVKAVKYEFKLSEIERYLPELHRKNEEEGCGVHFTVNYGGHRDREIKRINAVFFEDDRSSFDEQLEKISKSPIEPSIIVKTRKSLHVYFLADNVPVERFRELQERLAHFFDSDPQLRNESRTMRMPNFFHLKKDPVLVVVAKFNPEIRYDFAEIDAVFPKLPPKPKPKENTNLVLDINDSDFVVQYVKSRLNVVYEKEDKIICHCLFPQKHANNDAVPSAVFFKKTMHYYCSGCGASFGVYRLAAEMQWEDLKSALESQMKR